MDGIFSVVMPVRIDWDERLENLKAVLAWTDKIGCPIIVLEADKEPHCRFAETDYKHTEYIFVEDSAAVFHRTKYINILLRHVHTTVVAVWDVDMIIPLEYVGLTIDMIVKDKYTMFYPYSGIFYSLPKEISDTFRKNLDLNNLLFRKFKTMVGRRSCGGIYFVNREEYLSIGGENEKYVGWGPEDSERLRRTWIMGKKAGWLPSGPAYHLYHERDLWQEHENHPNLIEMRKEFVRECSMNRVEMQEYIRTELLANR